MSDKTVAEMLRECAEHSYPSTCTMMLDTLWSTYACPKGTCAECRKKMLNTLADMIDEERAKTEQSGVDVDALLKLADRISDMVDVPPYKCLPIAASTAREWKDTIRNAVKGAKPQLPEGVEWPRFEDGELVKFGDEYIEKETPCVMRRIEFKKDVGYKLGKGANHHWRPFGEPVKRPEPEVLDADGIPIRVGDTVYWKASGRKDVVAALYEGAISVVGSNGVFSGSLFTHRKPDTQEAIDADCMSDAKDYCERYGIKTEWPKHYGKAKCEHLLARQRKLLGGE